jgi:glycine/D-amino acid oxidase-like deaminating enzyme
MARYDVTVRGAGIFGLSIAYEAAKRGAKVQVIETVAIGAGSSGGLVGALTPHVPDSWNEKKAFQLESLLMAQTFWDGVAQTGGVDTGYARLGRLQPIEGSAGLELARARIAGAEKNWGNHAVWELRQATGAAWEPASPSGYLVFDSLSARLHPRRAGAALAAAITALGGRVILGDAADQGHVVWATGLAGLADLGRDLGRPMGGGVKGQAALLEWDAGIFPQIYADNLHIVPHSDGTVAIGSTSENTWDDTAATDDKLNALIARARATVPALAVATVIDRWAGIRPRASTRAPILGAWPNRAGHFVANGGFKIGFGMAPKIAQVMADLVLDGRDTIPPDFRL